MRVFVFDPVFNNEMSFNGGNVLSVIYRASVTILFETDYFVIFVAAALLSFGT